MTSTPPSHSPKPPKFGREVLSRRAEARWFIRFRWVAVVLEAVLVVAVAVLTDVLPVAPLLGLVGVRAITNLPFQRTTPSDRSIGLLLLADSWLLAAMLSFAGGASNPFTAVFFVHVTLAAVLLSGCWTVAVWLNALAAYGLTFLFLGPHAHHHVAGSHLYGMFGAFGITSAIIAGFVVFRSGELRRSERQLQVARTATARAERVASLTTLAAGAAHELGSPLSTIALVAGELTASTDAQREDVELILSEVRRCRAILDGMATTAGEVTGESVAEVPLAALFERVVGKLGSDERVEFEGEGMLRVPPAAAAQMLHNLVLNALDASTETVAVRWEGDRLTVSDRGAGMTDEQQAHAFDPFFTTKEDGAGRGLGLFLVRTTADALGCTIVVDSKLGTGTTVQLEFPEERIVR